MGLKFRIRESLVSVCWTPSLPEELPPFWTAWNWRSSRYKYTGIIMKHHEDDTEGILFNMCVTKCKSIKMQSLDNLFSVSGAFTLI